MLEDDHPMRPLLDTLSDARVESDQSPEQVRAWIDESFDLDDPADREQAALIAATFDLDPDEIVDD